MRPTLSLALLLLAPAASLSGQANPDRRVVLVEVRPAELQLAVGERAKVEIVALDADGNVVEGAFIQAFSSGAEVSFNPQTFEVEGTGHPCRNRRSANHLVCRDPLAGGGRCLF